MKEYSTQDIIELTGLNRQHLVELDKLNIVRPSSYRNDKKYKLYDEKKLDDLCIISLMIKCKETPKSIRKIMDDNNTKTLYELLDIVKKDSENIVKVITGMQIVGPTLFTESYNSIGDKSLSVIAAKMNSYEKKMEAEIEKVVNEIDVENENSIEDYDKKFIKVLNKFVDAKESKEKTDTEHAIDTLEEYFKAISKDNYKKYIIAEAIALQGNGLESETVNELVKKPISTYISESIFNRYVPIIEKEVNECLEEIDLNKNDYKDIVTQNAICKLVEVYDKYILFDDLSSKENQVLGAFKKIGIRGKNFNESDDFVIKALEYYKKQKEDIRNG